MTEAKKDEERLRDRVVSCRAWVEGFVVGNDLCPFAARPLLEGTVRWARVDADEVDALVAGVAAELAILLEASPDVHSTTLVVTPGWPELDDYLDAAGAVDAFLEIAGLVGEVQVVVFHPRFRFDGATPDDPANGVNRSPVPMLHLLREADVEAAVAAHPDPEGIPGRNAALLRSLALPREGSRS